MGLRGNTVRGHQISDRLRVQYHFSPLSTRGALYCSWSEIRRKVGGEEDIRGELRLKKDKPIRDWEVVQVTRKTSEQQEE